MSRRGDAVAIGIRNNQPLARWIKYIAKNPLSTIVVLRVMSIAEHPIAVKAALLKRRCLLGLVVDQQSREDRDHGEGHWEHEAVNHGRPNWLDTE
jgi:hypothetical protein